MTATQTEQTFIFTGWNVRQRRMDSLAYMALTAEDAWNTCAKLNPDFQVITWGQEDQMV